MQIKKKWGLRLCISKSSQVMPMVWVPGPHSEKEGVKAQPTWKRNSQAHLLRESAGTVLKTYTTESNVQFPWFLSAVL